MFKIGEFSRITQVSIRMLRYYDEQKLLVPHVIDEVTGYRLYAADQIDVVNRIVLLKHLGFSVKEMREMLMQWNPDQIKANLMQQMEKTEETIKQEQDRLRQIQSYLADLENQDRKLNIQIVIKSLPSLNVVSLRKIMPDYYGEGVLWQELGERIKGINGVDFENSFSVYHDLDDREQEVDIEVCAVANEEGITVASPLIYRQVEGVEKAACFMIYGPYNRISMAYKEFAYWLEQHPEYKMVGQNRQICHVTTCHTSNPEEYVTELQIPLDSNRM